MSGGIASRLAKLERAMLESFGTCRGCPALPGRFVVEFPHQRPPELDEEYRVRCNVCGRERTGTTVVMRLYGPSVMKDFKHGITRAA
jgi:hypothetical protein